MTYRKETTDYDVTTYSAIQDNDNHEIQISFSPNNLVCRVSVYPTPIPDSRKEITKEEYTAAYEKAVDTFFNYLRS